MYAVCKMEEPPPTETGVCGALVVWEIFKRGENAIYRQGYYKRNRHFQCGIETKLLIIYQNTYMVFIVHVFKFIW
jgi:hypothetical protein